MFYMADFDKNRFASKNQCGETQDELFIPLHQIFGFTRDVCASKDNTKRPLFFSEENSCLDKVWDGVNWMNPPFNNMKIFIKKAYEKNRRFKKSGICIGFSAQRKSTRCSKEIRF